MNRIYLATQNQKKVQEFSKLIPPSFGHISPLPEGVPESPETGTSFESNALQKAMYYAQYCEGWMLADDSGLCVDALSGKPGIYSARYAGEHATSEENNQKLLAALEGVPPRDRTATFVCALAMWHAQKHTGYVVRGTVSGTILTSLSGTNGFGYDPLFYVPEYEQTFSEMDAEKKNIVSHRAQAVGKLLSLSVQL